MLDGRSRLEIRLVGTVQGVGFRPFVFRLAGELGLDGFVVNDGSGVHIEVEGAPSRLTTFLERLPRDKPPAAHLYAFEHRWLAATGLGGFEIRESRVGERRASWVLPDLAICDACRAELLDPGDRRHRYPFLNCTHCGPRFTIVESIPYDRARTSMAGFPLCPACAAEFRDPADRRFHAQPTACARCGPRLRLIDPSGAERARDDRALVEAVRALTDGAIVGVKGLGGYHLMVDARREPAVAELRRRKRRSAKPFAVMVADLEQAASLVELSELSRTLLASSQAPILLLRRRLEEASSIAPSVAPGSPYLGLFLPYTPLHVLLLGDHGGPLVATSGNLSDEPIEHRDAPAERTVHPLCDLVLTHDRPIVRPADDSVLQILERPRPRVQALRRARGFAPLPVLAPRPLPPALAVGGQMNVTAALSRGREVIVSQHLGDMETLESREAYARTVEDLLRLFDGEPRLVAHDLHPDYHTTSFAAATGLPAIAVQHHHAHLAACMLENEVDDETLGLTWDGTGLGTDRTVWGGELLLGGPLAVRRVGTIHPFPLPGGEQAVREPWRVGRALLHEAFDGAAPEGAAVDGIDPARAAAVETLIRRGVRSPVTTSIGRLFDGVSALLGLTTRNSHQAEAAQRLEYAAWRAGPRAEPLPARWTGGDPWRLDWREAIRELVAERDRGRAVELLAARFHHTLARAALEAAGRVGCPRVALTGGVFCNRYLTELLAERLEEAGHRVLLHGQLPPTDGSLSVGQLWVAAHRTERGTA